MILEKKKTKSNYLNLFLSFIHFIFLGFSNNFSYILLVVQVLPGERLVTLPNQEGQDDIPNTSFDGWFIFSISRTMISKGFSGIAFSEIGSSDQYRHICLKEQCTIYQNFLPLQFWWPAERWASSSCFHRGLVAQIY